MVGSLGLRRRKQHLAHIGQIGFSVHDNFQVQGVGTVLMEASIDLAGKWLNIKWVELNVHTDN